MHVVCANTFGAIVLKPRFKIDAVIMIICSEHIRQVKGQMVTFPDLTATLKSAGSFKKQGTEA